VDNRLLLLLVWREYEEDDRHGDGNERVRMIIDYENWFC